MKKILLLVGAICISMGAVAQEEVSDELNSSFDLSYQAIENGSGMGINWVFNHLAINASLLSGDTNSNITKNEGWRVGIGGNYRKWLTDFLFAEASAGIEYSHATVEYKTSGGKTKNSDGDMGLFLTPRIGLKLFNITGTQFGVVAGYRWDFNKFKFSKDYTQDYFTIGIIGLF